MSEASREDLSLAHKLFADWVLALLNGQLTEEYTDKEGNVHTRVLRPTAAEMAVIRAFLKDNQITAPAAKGNSLEKLQEALEAKRRRGSPLPVARPDLPDLNEQLSEGPMQ